MKKVFFEMKNICKTYYPNIVAVDSACFSLLSGEIHALAGENGAGKTTLMKILYGLEKADSGEICLHNERVSIQSPNDAMNYKIGMVHQHFMLVEDMTIADNIVLGMEPKKKGLYDFQSACQLTNNLSQMYDMNIDPKAHIEDLTVGLKQKVEILKVLARSAELIILDEPTAVLTPQETKELFQQLRILKSKGHTIIIITHKLREIKEICDRVTIMKSGKMIGTYNVPEISIEDISKKMVGYDFEIKPIINPTSIGKKILSVQGLTVFNSQKKVKLNQVSFSIFEGEILGVVGVEGNGQSELAKVLNGQIRSYEGNIYIEDKLLKGRTIKEIRDLGLSYIPEDRMIEGVNLEGSILESAMVLKARDKEYHSGMFLKKEKLIQYTEKLINDYQIKCDSHKEVVRFLSGGNVQKIVSAREINACERILIANQPTRGIDIGAVLTLHEKIKQLQKEKKAVLLISSDLKEIYNLTQSVIVLFEGEIVARIPDISKVSEEELGCFMLGLKRQKAEEVL
ncbi:ABC transporter ATP-binding protein [Mycoplasmatota bacterium WC30]